MQLKIAIAYKKKKHKVTDKPEKKTKLDKEQRKNITCLF